MTAPQKSELDPVVKFINWFNRHRGALIGGGTVVLAVTLGVLWFIWGERRKEALAARELADARVALASGNLALAASDLSQLTTRYEGAPSAEEALLLLAQIRLQQQEPGAAIVELRKLIAAGPSAQFRAPAHGLLGHALEQSGNFPDAAQEYLKASNAAFYEAVQAQYLIDAGRSFAIAGDTLQAATAYERVIDEFGNTDLAVEAKVRLGELRPNVPEI